MLRAITILSIIFTTAINAWAGDPMNNIPDTWQLFSYVDQYKVEMADHQSIPTALPAEHGILVRPITIQPDPSGLIDIEKIAGGFHNKACAMLFTEITVDKPTKIKIGTSADWYMQWRVNGKEVLSTLDFGNNRYYLGGDRNMLLDYVIELPLIKGKNIIAIKVLAGSRKWFFYAGADDEVRAAKVFEYKRLADYMDQPLEIIHDEEQIPEYELPEVLVSKDGYAVGTKEQWEGGRRQEILELFNQSIYGAIPRDYDAIKFDTVVEDENALGGIAIRRKVTITIENAGKTLDFPLHIFHPKNSGKRVPVVLLIYARSPNDKWDFSVDSNYWPIRRLVESGFAAASFNRRVLAADNAEHYGEGILSLYPGLTEKRDGWRTISAWAYGAMRCIDYLVTDEAIDGEKIAVVGHSRGGKTALWTAANDERVRIAFVNGSGAVGAALSRRKMGEHLPGTNRGNPHWYNENYKACKDENDLPVDQHMLISLVAPRAICIGGAVGDPEADPKGEYLSLVGADGVYELYGMGSIGAMGQPRLEEAVSVDGRSFHVRYGNHDMNEFDWGVYIEAAGREFGGE